MPRFSIFQLMVAVACVALLIPTGIAAILESLVILVKWYFLPILIVVVVDAWRKPRVSIVVFAILFGVGAYIFCWHVSPISPIRIWPLWVNRIVTPIHLVGPIFLARQLWRAWPIGSGEILWAWSGLSWMCLITTPLRSHYNPTLDQLAGFASVLSALVLWLAIFSKRLRSTRPTWTYYLGWGLVEYDAIAWGWYALN